MWRRTKACCTNWSIPQKTICSSKKLGCRSLLYIVKLRDQCCLFFFQFNLSTKPATQIHVLQTNHESEILTNSDFWQIKVVRTEHVSKKISTFIQSGFLTNKSRPNPTFTIGQKSWLDKSTVSGHFYWSKVNIALARRRPVKKNMWILSIPDCTAFFFQWSEQFEANEKTDRFSLFFRMRMPIFQKKNIGDDCKQRQDKAFTANRIQTWLILIVFSNIRVL